ncbi:hypothetical protein Hamer_G013976 [Homarus americanus]|uniref:Uncharacterized protein n=1 Tax=Homarus americanus TaxID=6706 RepID=A0A8J5JSN8_HOMAM|nr:hypothetical protein Hamer_G013976 [Homarus americanus]
MTICLNHPDEGNSHMVSVYRALDGRYLYYDSAQTAVDESFLKYMDLNKIPRQGLTIVDAPNQRYNTCAYHSYVFLDFVTSRYYHTSYNLAQLYKMAAISCHTAVLSVFKMLTEFPNKINIFTRSVPRRSPWSPLGVPRPSPWSPLGVPRPSPWSPLGVPRPREEEGEEGGEEGGEEEEEGGEEEEEGGEEEEEEEEEEGEEEEEEEEEQY